MKGIIDIEDLVRKFGDFTAVDKVSISIEKGQIFGILGPNGAGKTTTINMILGLLEPTSGSITVNGLDVSRHTNEVKQMTGLMTQETIVDSELTAAQNLEIAARLYHLSTAERRSAVKEALKEAELTDFANAKAGSLSGGMKRRLYLVKTMIQRPDILILDEPTTGLDVQNRVQMWGHIRALQQRGITIVLTTQYLEEADQLCNRIAVIDHGKVVATGTPTELKRLVSSGRVMEVITTSEEAQKAADFLRRKFKLDIKVLGEKLECFLEKDPVDTFGKVLDSLVKAKMPIISISMHLPTMDDVFIKLTGSSMRDSVGEQVSDRSNIMLKR